MQVVDLYFCTENFNKIKDIIININNFYILDINNLLKDFKNSSDSPYVIYTINNYVKEAFETVSTNKKYIGIIYINKNFDNDLLERLKGIEFINNIVRRYVLMDNALVPKHKSLYKYFGDVIFFNRFKKMKL